MPCLIRAGHEVVVVDSLTPSYGGSLAHHRLGHLRASGAVGDLTHPVRESPEELPVVVRGAGREVEASVGLDSPDRAGRHAQFAAQAGVPVDGLRLLIVSDLGIGEHHPDQDEVTEFGVDDIAVNSHLPEARGHRDGFHRDRPDLAGKPVGLHREPAGRADCAIPPSLEFIRDRPCNLVGLVDALVEFVIGHRAGRRAHVAPVHLHHERDCHSRSRQ